MRLTLNDVRVAYAQGLFEARAPKAGDRPKYGCAFLFPRDHAAVKLVSDAVIKIAQEKWGPKAADVLKELKAGNRLPIHDGDGKASSAGYAGNLFMNAGNQIRPLIINSDKTALVAADGKPYSGCYVNAMVEIWAQDNQHGKRVNASLLGVQFVRDGERLAGGSVATADDFEALPGADGEGSAQGQVDPAKLFA